MVLRFVIVLACLSLACARPAVRDPAATALAALAIAIDQGDGAQAARLVVSLPSTCADPMATSLAARPLAARLFGLGDQASRLAAATMLERLVAWRRAGLGGEDDVDVAALLGDLATVHYFLGEWERSEELDRQVLALRLRLLGPSAPEVADGRRALGSSAYKRGNLREAGELFEAALAGRRSAPQPDPSCLAGDLNALGELRRAEGDFELARRLLAEAEALAVDHPRQLALILGNAGLLAKDEGRLDTALAQLDRALAITRQLEPPDPYRIALAQQNRAEALREARRLDEAEVAMAEAVALARTALGDRSAELGSFLSQRATLHAARGAIETAQAGWREALGVLAATVAVDHPLRAQTQHDAGVALCAAGAAGETLLREAVAGRQARYGARHPDTAMSLARLGACVARDENRRDEALLLVREALEVFANTSAYPLEEAEALAVEAELLLMRGLALEAIEPLRRAVVLVEQQRSIAGGGDAARAERFALWAERYRWLAQLELEVGDVDAAFLTAERMRARIFLEQLAAGRVDVRAGIDPAILAPLEADERRVRALVASIQRGAAFASERDDLEPHARRELLRTFALELDIATKELARLDEEIRRVSPLWRDVATAGGVLLDRAAAQAEVVPADGWLLVYQLGREDGRLLAIPKSGPPIGFKLEVDAAQAAALGVSPGAFGSRALAQVLQGDGADGAPAVIAGTRGLVKVTPLGAHAVASPAGRLQALWRALIPRALWPQLAVADEVVVVADGPLHRLPLEALVVRAGRNPRYWLDDGPRVRYAASASALAALGRRTVPTAGGALVVADPRFGLPPANLRSAAGRGDLPALPGTAAEAAAIEDALSTQLRVGRLEGAAAHERGVRAALSKPNRIVHFATHGLVDEQHAELLAGLALTPGAEDAGNEDDGFLQLFEVYGLGLDAELAVLSACDSAVGLEVAGEGVFALSRGFLAAGARNVVASQWPVDDSATAALMTTFYRELAADLAAGRPLDVSRALDRARQRVRQDPRWSSPVYWAPFVLTGSPSRGVVE